MTYIYNAMRADAVHNGIPTLNAAHQSQRSLHSTPLLLQRPDHPLFGLVDWSQTQSGKYAVVDPNDPANILYLTHREYVIHSRVAISNDMALVVLATPRDTPPGSDTTSSSDTKSSDQGRSPRLSVPRNRRKLSYWFDVASRRARVARLKLAFSSPLASYCPIKISEKKSYETLRHGARKGDKVVPMIEVNSRNAADLVRDWSDLLWFRFFGCKLSAGAGSSFALFGRYVAMSIHHTGVFNTVLRLKAELFAVLSYVAGVPLKTTQQLGIRVRLRGGLPARLSHQTRLAIRSGNLKTLRLWISILNMYRALKAPHPPASLGAITYPKWEEGKSAYWDDFVIFCKWRFRDMLPGWKRRGDGTKFFATKKLYSSQKAGPHGPSSEFARADLVVWLLKASHIAGYFADKTIGVSEKYSAFKAWWLYAQVNQDYLLSLVPIGEVLNLTRDRRLSRCIELLVVLFDTDTISASSIPEDLKFLFEEKRDTHKGDGEGNPLIRPVWAIEKGLNAPRSAKLVALKEPAGKVRNIVCFDWWSQALLLPFHEFLMGLLRGMPSDATFDQDEGVRKFSEKGFMYIASLDLKTATEFIPQQLYQAVLGPIMGLEAVGAWLRLLVDRDIYPTEDYWVSSHSDTFRYVRGQPMGALSSWPAMALVHHAVVQFSAYLAGWRVHFPDYMVLGDDIVIANEAVADTYVKVVEDLGIKVGLAKSFVSRKGFGNFAGRSFLGSEDLSPISLSEEIAVRGPAARMELVWRTLRRGIWSLSDTGWATCLLRWSLPRSAFQQIQDWRYARKVDPLLRAVFMASFGQPERVNSLVPGQGVSVNSFFAGLNLSLKIFGMPLKTYFDQKICNNRNVSIPLITAIIAKAKSLERRYKPLWACLQRLSVEESRRRKYLSVLPRDALPSDKEWLRDMIELYDTLETVLERFREWRKLNMPLVRTILAAAGDGNINEHLLVYTVELSLEEMWNRLTQAEQSLPVALDYLLGGKAVDQQADPLVGFRSLDRLLSNLEHLVETSMPPCDSSDLAEGVVSEAS